MLLLNVYFNHSAQGLHMKVFPAHVLSLLTSNGSNDFQAVGGGFFGVANGLLVFVVKVGDGVSILADVGVDGDGNGAVLQRIDVVGDQRVLAVPLPFEARRHASVAVQPNNLCINYGAVTRRFVTIMLLIST